MNIDLDRVGIWSPSAAWDHSPELADAAAELEELGYGALWLGSSRGDLELPAALIQSTRRLVVTTAIINVWTNPASELAARYAQLEARAPNRLLIWLGSSHALLVEPAGFSSRQPLRRLAGYLDALDQSIPTIPTGRRVLGVLGPRALDLAARRSAGAHPYLVTPEYTRQARAALGAGPLLAVEQKLVLETDPCASASTTPPAPTMSRSRCPTRRTTNRRTHSRGERGASSPQGCGRRSQRDDGARAGLTRASPTRRQPLGIISQSDGKPADHSSIENVADGGNPDGELRLI